MRIFQLARRPPQWLRAALAGVLLAFALNSIAHVTHRHEATQASVIHGLACGYCASFGGVADAPRHSHALLPVAQRFSVVVATTPGLAVVFRLQTSARPRAPPLS